MLFRSEGVQFAYPHVHHVFDETSGAARLALDDAAGRPAATDRDRDRRPRSSDQDDS